VYALSQNSSGQFTSSPIIPENPLTKQEISMKHSYFHHDGSFSLQVGICLTPDTFNLPEAPPPGPPRAFGATLLTPFKGKNGRKA
jgi:hypothetical protein